MFDLTEGVDDSGTLPAPGSSGSDTDVESVSSTRWVLASDGDAESMVGVVVLTAGSSLLMQASSTWKFSVPIVRPNPPVIAEVDPVKRG
jgi:hypothetical protein